MKLFEEESRARKSLNEKEKTYTNSLCPFDRNRRLCGSWCALFYYDQGTETRRGYIILGCKGTDKKLYIG